MEDTLIRVRAFTEYPYGRKHVDERFAYTEQHAKNIVRGFKGRRYCVAVNVDVLHFAAEPRPDLSFGPEV